MIRIEREPHGLGPPENCCFCNKPTRMWAQPQDIAVCGLCARRYSPADLPTKAEWCKGSSGGK